MSARDEHSLTAIKKPESLKQEVYDRIKTAILTNQLAPAQKLDETKIGDLLGVSRTPVREAFTRLAYEGLVFSSPNRGIYVTRITPDDLMEILEIREVLEGLAAASFTNRADAAEVERLAATMQPFTLDNVETLTEEYSLANVEFHNLIMEGAQNERLTRSLNSLYDHLALAKELHLISTTKRAKRSLEEHHRIIAAVRAGDAAEAERQMRLHLGSLRDDVERTYRDKRAAAPVRFD